MRQALAVAIMIGLAAYLGWLGLASPAGLHAPPAILFILSLAMLSGALALWARLGGYTRINAIFAAIVLFSFAAAGYWIGFSPNATGRCTLEAGTPSDDAFQWHVSGLTCRLVFGSGAVVSTIAGVLALVSIRRK